MFGLSSTYGHFCMHIFLERPRARRRSSRGVCSGSERTLSRCAMMPSPHRHRHQFRLPRCSLVMSDRQLPRSGQGAKSKYEDGCADGSDDRAHEKHPPSGRSIGDLWHPHPGARILDGASQCEGQGDGDPIQEPREDEPQRKPAHSVPFLSLPPENVLADAGCGAVPRRTVQANAVDRSPPPWRSMVGHAAVADPTTRWPRRLGDHRTPCAESNTHREIVGTRSWSCARGGAIARCRAHDPRIGGSHTSADRARSDCSGAGGSFEVVLPSTASRCASPVVLPAAGALGVPIAVPRPRPDATGEADQASPRDRHGYPPNRMARDDQRSQKAGATRSLVPMSRSGDE
jgi:hypothetical protein